MISGMVMLLRSIRLQVQYMVHLFMEVMTDQGGIDNTYVQ